MSQQGSRFLSEPEAVRLIGEYGIEYPEHRLASTHEEAVAAANAIGYPVVLKAVSPGLTHKSDVGGVVLHLNDAAEVRHAYEQLQRSLSNCVPPAAAEGVLVCRQAVPGAEVIVGGLRDSTFGPVVMFGWGGIFAEILDDVAFRVAPVTRSEAKRLVHDTRAWMLVQGSRGMERGNMERLVDVLTSASQLMIDHPEVSALDLNPVRVTSGAAIALDARVEVSEATGVGDLKEG